MNKMQISLSSTQMNTLQILISNISVNINANHIIHINKQNVNYAITHLNEYIANNIIYFNKYNVNNVIIDFN